MYLTLPHMLHNLLFFELVHAVHASVKTPSLLPESIVAISFRRALALHSTQESKYDSNSSDRRAPTFEVVQAYTVSILVLIGQIPAGPQARREGMHAGLFAHFYVTATTSLLKGVATNMYLTSSFSVLQVLAKVHPFLIVVLARGSVDLPSCASPAYFF